MLQQLRPSCRRKWQSCNGVCCIDFPLRCLRTTLNASTTKDTKFHEGIFSFVHLRVLCGENDRTTILSCYLFFIDRALDLRWVLFNVYFWRV